MRHRLSWHNAPQALPLGHLLPYTMHPAAADTPRSETRKPLLILSDSSLGKVVAEVLQAHDMLIYGFLDKRAALQGQEMYHLPVFDLTQQEALLGLVPSQCHAFVALEALAERMRMVGVVQAREGLAPVSAIHPHSYISPQASHIGQGILLGAGGSIGPGAVVHNHCFLESQATLAQDVVLHEGAHIGAGTLIGAGAQLGSQVYIGPGCVV